MEKEGELKKSTIVRVFMALIVVLGAFCCYVVVASIPHLFRNPYENLSPWINLSIWLDTMLTALISLALLYQLFRLVKRIIKGDPFNAENPRRVRNVAYAALAISVSHLVFSSVRDGLLSRLHSDWSIAASILIKGAIGIFLILGLLIIARLLDTGVRLQQDQNLTV